MQFSLSSSISVLEKTPLVLRGLLSGLDETWTTCNEGSDTWSVFDIVGHLIHGEHTDWMTRVRIILSGRPETERRFEKFDRFAQFEESKGKSLDQLLTEFEHHRASNLNALQALALKEADFDCTGVHPSFGKVTLRQLLATWMVHYLNHLAQIARVMAKQYHEEVGPWKEYLRILQS